MNGLFNGRVLCHLGVFWFGDKALINRLIPTKPLILLANFSILNDTGASFLDPYSKMDDLSCYFCAISDLVFYSVC